MVYKTAVYTSNKLDYLFLEQLSYGEIYVYNVILAVAELLTILNSITNIQSCHQSMALSLSKCV